MLPRGAFEWLVVSVAVGVVGVNIAAILITADGAGRPREQHVKTAAKALAPVATAKSVPERVRDRPPARANVFAVTATRGDSWLAIRSGSARGRVLYENTLERGATLRLRSERIWIRFGAATNVDVSVNGKQLPLPLFGTFDAVAEPGGVRRAG